MEKGSLEERVLELEKTVEKQKKRFQRIRDLMITEPEVFGFDDMAQHNFKQLLDLGLCVTINSDDPAYFGGYLTENYLAAQQALDLSRDDLYRVTRNSFEATFLEPAEKNKLIAELDGFMKS